MEKDSKMLVRLQLLEERVAYLESIIKGFQGQTQGYHDIDEVRENIVITDYHLSQILQTSMEEQIILMIIEINKKTPFIKMAKELSMYKGGWVHMDDSDLKCLHFVRAVMTVDINDNELDEEEQKDFVSNNQEKFKEFQELNELFEDLYVLFNYSVGGIEELFDEQY
jgi:hypothetical protein